MEKDCQRAVRQDIIERAFTLKYCNERVGCRVAVIKVYAVVVSLGVVYATDNKGIG